MNTQFKKIYVVSLINNHYRQKFIKEEFDDLGIEFEFVYGTDFYNLKYDGHNNKIIYPNPWRHTGLDDKPDFSRDFGCALTHYNAILFAYELGYNNVLIVEDDMCFIKNKQLIYELLNNIPDDADYVTWDPRFLSIDLYNKCIKLMNNNQLYTNITGKFQNEIFAGGMFYGLMNRNTMETYIKNQHKSFSMSDQVVGFNVDNNDIIKYVCNKCICTDQYNIYNNFKQDIKTDVYTNLYHLINPMNKDMFYIPNDWDYLFTH